MHAATSRLYFQTLCQHEVFRVISTMNAGSLCSRQVKGYEQQKILLLHLKKHEKISRLAV